MQIVVKLHYPLDSSNWFLFQQIQTNLENFVDVLLLSKEDVVAVHQEV
jgi:hypothetical protein